MDDFQSFINSMIKGSYGTNQNKKEVSSQNFDSTTMCDDNFQNYSNRCKDFWNNLLINLHDKVRIGAEEKYHYGIRNKKERLPRLFKKKLISEGGCPFQY